MLKRLTGVFGEVDDFCQSFEAQWQACLIGIGAAHLALDPISKKGLERNAQSMFGAAIAKQQNPMVSTCEPTIDHSR